MFRQSVQEAWKSPPVVTLECLKAAETNSLVQLQRQSKLITETPVALIPTLNSN